MPTATAAINMRLMLPTTATTAATTAGEGEAQLRRRQNVPLATHARKEENAQRVCRLSLL